MFNQAPFRPTVPSLESLAKSDNDNNNNNNTNKSTAAVARDLTRNHPSGVDILASSPSSKRSSRHHLGYNPTFTLPLPQSMSSSAANTTARIDNVSSKNVTTTSISGGWDLLPGAQSNRPLGSNSSYHETQRPISSFPFLDAHSKNTTTTTTTTSNTNNVSATAAAVGGAVPSQSTQASSSSYGGSVVTVLSADSSTPSGNDNNNSITNTSVQYQNHYNYGNEPMKRSNSLHPAALLAESIRRKIEATIRYYSDLPPTPTDASQKPTAAAATSVASVKGEVDSDNSYMHAKLYHQKPKSFFSLPPLGIYSMEALSVMMALGDVESSQIDFEGRARAERLRVESLMKNVKAECGGGSELEDALQALQQNVGNKSTLFAAQAVVDVDADDNDDDANGATTGTRAAPKLLADSAAAFFSPFSDADQRGGGIGGLPFSSSIPSTPLSAVPSSSLPLSFSMMVPPSTPRQLYASGAAMPNRGRARVEAVVVDCEKAISNIVALTEMERVLRDANETLTALVSCSGSNNVAAPTPDTLLAKDTPKIYNANDRNMNGNNNGCENNNNTPNSDGHPTCSPNATLEEKQTIGGLASLSASALAFHTTMSASMNTNKRQLAQTLAHASAFINKRFETLATTRSRIERDIMAQLENARHRLGVVVGAKTGDLTLKLRSLATADDFDPSFAVLVKDSETIVDGLRATQDIVRRFAGLAADLAAVCFGLDRFGKVDLDDDDKSGSNNGSFASHPTVAKVESEGELLSARLKNRLQHSSHRRANHQHTRTSAEGTAQTQGISKEVLCKGAGLSSASSCGGPYVALVESFEELLKAVVTGIQRWEAGGNDEEATVVSGNAAHRAINKTDTTFALRTQGAPQQQQPANFRNPKHNNAEGETLTAPIPLPSSSTASAVISHTRGSVRQMAVGGGGGLGSKRPREEGEEKEKEGSPTLLNGSATGDATRNATPVVDGSTPQTATPSLPLPPRSFAPPDVGQQHIRLVHAAASVVAPTSATLTVEAKRRNRPLETNIVNSSDDDEEGGNGDDGVGGAVKGRGGRSVVGGFFKAIGDLWSAPSALSKLDDDDDDGNRKSVEECEEFAPSAFDNDSDTAYRTAKGRRVE